METLAVDFVTAGVAGAESELVIEAVAASFASGVADVLLAALAVLVAFFFAATAGEALGAFEVVTDDVDEVEAVGAAPSSTYPFLSFSAMSLSCDLVASDAESKVLVCVCPEVPTRPNVTVCESPSNSIRQNLLELPSLKTREREEMLKVGSKSESVEISG